MFTIAHKLLAKQITKYSLSLLDAPEALINFLKTVEIHCQLIDRDRELLSRSFLTHTGGLLYDDKKFTTKHSSD